MRRIHVLLLSACVAGCNAPTQNSALAASNGSSNAAIPTEADQLSKIEERLNKLEADDFSTNISKHDVAFMQPTDSGYSLLDTDFGRLAISIENVQPYASGSQITLQIGNPTSARFSNVKAKIEWGSLGQDKLPIDDHTHSLNWAPTDTLPAASWHTVVINMPDVPPAQLGWIRISEFNTGSVFMIRG
jgi:hypothetical protein